MYALYCKFQNILFMNFQVYGVPDERMGEEVCASVIVKDSATFTEADIRVYSKGKVSFYFVGYLLHNKYIYIFIGFLKNISSFRSPISRFLDIYLLKKLNFPKQHPAKYKN